MIHDKCFTEYCWHWWLVMYRIIDSFVSSFEIVCCIYRIICFRFIDTWYFSLCVITPKPFWTCIACIPSFLDNRNECGIRHVNSSQVIDIIISIFEYYCLNFRNYWKCFRMLFFAIVQERIFLPVNSIDWHCINGLMFPIDMTVYKHKFYWY